MLESQSTFFLIFFFFKYYIYTNTPLGGVINYLNSEKDQLDFFTSQLQTCLKVNIKEIELKIRNKRENISNLEQTLYKAIKNYDKIKKEKEEEISKDSNILSSACFSLFPRSGYLSLVRHLSQQACCFRIL